MTQLQAMTNQIALIAPAGFYVALRVGFSFPEEELNCLPEMGLPDPQQVRAHAAVFGLGHGLAISHMTKADKGRRSYGLFFRDDRDFESVEVWVLQGMLEKLHAGREEEPTLTAAEVEALKMQSEGLRLKQIAARLGISESAVKARLDNVKRKLGAKTQSQAAYIAASRRIL